MARLQDFQTVTPTASDKLLVVQSQGQGLSTLEETAKKFFNSTSLKDARIVSSRYGSSNSFKTSIAEPLISCNAEIVATQSGSGTPSPSNVRAISGYSVCSLTTNGSTKKINIGINQWDEQWEVGDINNSTGQNQPDSTSIRSVDYIEVKGGESYYFRANSGSFKFMVYDKDKNFIDYFIRSRNSVQTMGNNICYVRFVMINSYGSIYNNDISINYPSTETKYNKWTGSGIVYGGKIDCFNGIGTKTHISVNLGALSWTRRTDTTVPIFQSQLPIYGTSQATSEIPDIISEVFSPTSAANVSQSGYDNTITLSSDGQRMYIQCQTYTDATEFTNAMSGKYAVYALNTPTIFSTSPIKSSTINGTNSISANTGKTQVTFTAKLSDLVS